MKKRQPMSLKLRNLQMPQNKSLINLQLRKQKLKNPPPTPLPQRNLPLRSKTLQKNQNKRSNLPIKLKPNSLQSQKQRRSK